MKKILCSLLCSILIVETDHSGRILDHFYNLRPGVCSPKRGYRSWSYPPYIRRTLANDNGMEGVVLTIEQRFVRHIFLRRFRREVTEGAVLLDGAARPRDDLVPKFNWN